MKLRTLGILTSTLTLACVVPSGYGQATFTAVGDLPGGVVGSQIRAANETGTIAVGTGTVLGTAANQGSGDTPAYWTQSGGLVALPSGVTISNPNFLPFVTASDVTADGSVVAGRVRVNSNNNSRQAAIWTNGGTTLTTLGFLPGVVSGFSTQSAVNALSNDGSIAYGFGTNSTGRTEALRWTADSGMVGLGFLNPGDTTSAVAGRGTSADGSKAVGTSGSAFFGPGTTAFIYQEGSGMQTLGVLNTGTWSAAIGISSDGSTVIGIGDTAANPDGDIFLWTEGGGMQDLGAGYNPSNFGSLNSDGTIGVTGGTFFNSSGLYSLQSVLSGAGLNLSGWSNFYAFGISDNSNVVWGTAVDAAGNTQGYVATFDSGYLARVGQNSSTVPDGSSVAGMLGLVGACLIALRRKIRSV